MTEYLIIEEKSSEIGSKLFSAMLLLLRKKIVGPIYSDVLEVFFCNKNLWRMSTDFKKRYFTKDEKHFFMSLITTGGKNQQKMF